MRILVDVIPREQQPYQTDGDWQFLGDDLVVRVFDNGNEWSHYLIAIHEIVEAVLCKRTGISSEVVRLFDRDHPSLIYPGRSKYSPYRAQHHVATKVEDLVGKALKVPWKTMLEALDVPPQSYL